MIATVDIADLGTVGTLRAVRRPPKPEDVPGLRWAQMAAAVPLASKRPPTFRRALRLAFWDDEAAIAAFRSHDELAPRFADGFQATLSPARAFGSWPGLPDDVPRSRAVATDGPVVVFTLGQLRLSQAPRFFRASRPAERTAVESPGLVWGTASVRPPFVATVSVWRDAASAAHYAYDHDPEPGGVGKHDDAIAAQRRKDFHRQSAFIRFTPITMTGALPDGAVLAAAP